MATTEYVAYENIRDQEVKAGGAGAPSSQDSTEAITKKNTAGDTTAGKTTRPTGFYGSLEEGVNGTTPLNARGNLQREMSWRSWKSLARTLVTFLKSMVGSYILYTPKMFHNGGIVAATITLLTSAMVACDNMLVLLQCAEYTGKNSYGQIGGAAIGPRGKLMVDVSLVLSQLSFCCTYFVFIVGNVPRILPIPAPGSLLEWLLAPDVLVTLQLVVYIPMAFFRSLKDMALVMFIANVCVWSGLILITYIDAETVIRDGPQPVLLYNPDTFVLFMGAIVVCFEGIGLVLPVREDVEPHLRSKYPGLIQGAMFFIAVIFACFACLGYLAYGDDIKTFVTMNIPRDNPLGTMSVALYSVTIILTYPLQLFPAITCLERYLLFQVDEKNAIRGWLQNGLRTLTVLFTAWVARYAGHSFDNFAGLIGGVCAVPLALIYPAVFQLCLLRDNISTLRKCWTWLVLLAGCFSCVLCTWQSITTWK